MSLAPALSVTLGSLRYDTHAAGASICLALLPRGNSAEVALPSNVRFEAASGDKAIVSLDGGEGAQTVLTGKVNSIRRDFEIIHVVMTDIGDLAGYRPSATLEGQDAKAVVNKLASDVSVSTGDVDIDLDLGAFVAHPGRTAAEHIAQLAELAGGIAYSGGDGSLTVKQKPSGPADSALKYGREVISYETRSVLGAQSTALCHGIRSGGIRWRRRCVASVGRCHSRIGSRRRGRRVARSHSRITRAVGSHYGLGRPTGNRRRASRARYRSLLPAADAAAGKRNRSARASQRIVQRAVAHHPRAA